MTDWRRWLAMLWVLTALGLFVVSTLAARVWDHPAIAIAAAVITFPVCYFGSVVWQRVFLRELGL